MEFKNICLECAHYKVCKDKEKFIEKSKSIYYSIEDSDILKVSIDCKNFLKPNKRIRNDLMYSKYAFGRLSTNSDLDSEEKETEDGRDL